MAWYLVSQAIAPLTPVKPSMQIAVHKVRASELVIQSDCYKGRHKMALSRIALDDRARSHISVSPCGNLDLSFPLTLGAWAAAS